MTDSNSYFGYQFGVSEYVRIRGSHLTTVLGSSLCQRLMDLNTDASWRKRENLTVLWWEEAPAPRGAAPSEQP